MAIKKGSEATENMQNQLNDHDLEIKNQKQITMFFIIIVAMTLVGTLVGIGGLYINAVEKNKSVDGYTNALIDLKSDISNINLQLANNNLQFQLLKANNPRLK